MHSAKENAENDCRKVAIYARKSKITETGKSIENQITKCRCYAELKFDAQDDDILVYQDEGLSGFYSDRPQYMEMLQDIQANKIRAVICYKFDRISRRTLDLLNLVEQLKTKKIAFISCTDDVDTSSRTGKIVMSLLASIAEFERDIIAERIADNMYELAKEGRWLGGTTPTGFYSQKEHFTVNGKKTTVNHLEPIEEEQQIVIQMFGQFLENRSVEKVLEWTKASRIQTKTGTLHTRVSIKNILSNPVYAVANEDTYAYFQAFDVPIYAEKDAFDGVHGLMIYNKTEQTKELKDNSTAIHPKYVQRMEKRDISEWIIAVGKHTGLISGKDWITAQKVLQDNRDKFTRPNEKTQSLLSGLIACPYCGKNMYTHRESGRYTAGLPRFLYKCQTKKNYNTCDYKDVKGNEIDQFVIEAICSMSEEGNAYYLELMNNEATLSESANNLQQQINQLKKSTDKINREISGQTQNLRLVSEVTRPFILEDIERLAAELSKSEEQLAELEKLSTETQQDVGGIEKARELIFSFPKLVEVLSYQEKIELVRKVVEKVFVLYKEDGDEEVHIFLKGTPEEKYDDFFQKEPGRSDVCARGSYSIFNTTGRIGSKSRAFGIVEGVDGFDQADGADGNEVILIAHRTVIFFNDMGDKAEVVFDELVACAQVTFLAVSLQIFALFFQRERAGKGAGIDNMQRHIKNVRQRLKQFQQHMYLTFPMDTVNKAVHKNIPCWPRTLLYAQSVTEVPVCIVDCFSIIRTYDIPVIYLAQNCHTTYNKTAAQDKVSVSSSLFSVLLLMSAEQTKNAAAVRPIKHFWFVQVQGFSHQNAKNLALSHRPSPGRWEYRRQSMRAASQNL